jgi:uncharacterized protein YkwD
LDERDRRWETAVRIHLISNADRARYALKFFLVALLAAGLAALAEARADAIGDAQLLRRSGCAGLMPPQRPLRHLVALDTTAAHWALGDSIGQAAARSGYSAEQLAGVHVTGSDDAVLAALRRSACATLMRADLTGIGLYRHGDNLWLVVASAQRRATPADLRAFASRVLDLVNATRARGASCGRRPFAPAPPVRLSTELAAAARGHAIDMAEHEYFEHQDLSGHTPADRVRALGYREKLVGENIAYGPRSPEEVVRGWLDSPEHCENIMNPRFAEMGIAYALGPAPAPASGRGLYWVQVLADPKS